MFTGTLLPYQPEAVDRMVERKAMLVAYEMGLGKTVLTIAAIERLREQGEITGPGLVVALSSLKYQWKKSIEQFTSGTATALVIDGTKKQRMAQYEESENYDYVILNYESVVNDWAVVNTLSRSFVVLDEATAIKSFRAKRSKAAKKLTSPIRFALTGTPLENGRPEELFSIMQFVDPHLLGRFDLFDRTFIVRNSFGAPVNYRNLQVLHSKIKEASTRKSQSDPDVAPHLPETIHLDPITPSLDRASATLYNKIRQDLLDELDEAQSLFGTSFNVMSHYGMESDQGGPADEIRGRIMSRVTALRMLCTDPQLLRDSADNFTGMTGKGSQYLAYLLDEGFLDGNFHPVKIDAVTSYVNDFLELDSANKAVIFCGFVSTLDRIGDGLSADSVLYSGQMSSKEKEHYKELFQTDPEVRVLISSDAGGYGVDLPQANLLVNANLPWSSGAMLQRNGRIKRASSQWKTVVVQDILIANSIEVRQHQMLNQKSAVAAAIVDGVGIDDKGGLKLTVGSLRQFLDAVTV